MEIDADQITRSPSHTAAWDKPANFETDTKGKGLSLRFPRMKVWRRDKDAVQATSVQELLKMFELRNPTN
jgi:ATP-dependent DNA ligase